MSPIKSDCLCSNQIVLWWQVSLMWSDLIEESLIKSDCSLMTTISDLTQRSLIKYECLWSIPTIIWCWQLTISDKMLESLIYSNCLLILIKFECLNVLTCMVWFLTNLKVRSIWSALIKFSHLCFYLTIPDQVCPGSILCVSLSLNMSYCLFIRPFVPSLPWLNSVHSHSLWCCRPHKDNQTAKIQPGPFCKVLPSIFSLSCVIDQT